MKNMKYTATQAAIVSMNVPHKREIDETTFSNILCGDVDPLQWASHLEIFFSDVPFVLISTIVKENNVSFEDIVSIFSKLPEVYQNKDFKVKIHENMGNFA